MITICDKKNCMGCHACANICPKKCITMKEDEEGFLYPQVDQEKCVDCHLCDKICPVINNKKRIGEKPRAFACINKNEIERMSSSSGGIFTILARQILNQGGVVFGVGFDENFEVAHMAIEKEEEIEKLQGSKYVQSRIGDSYQQAKKYLNEGRKVLFTGTPCQIGGLLAYLGKDYDNLYTQDIICHGVPSPGVWKKYLQYRECEANSKVAHIKFREKDKKWKPYFMHIKFENGEEYRQTMYKDPMFRMFFMHWCLRPACHACVFKDKLRLSDITLADFWGVKNVAPDMHDNKGTSLVLAHSEKGRALIEQIKDFMVCKEVDFEQAIKKNPSIQRSSRPSFRRKGFIKAYQKIPFEKVVKRYKRKVL